MGDRDSKDSRIHVESEVNLCGSGCKRRLDEHDMLINKLILKHQQLTTSFQHLKAGHQELCDSNENRGRAVFKLVADSKMQHRLFMRNLDDARSSVETTRSSVETELITLNQTFNDLHGQVEALEQSLCGHVEALEQSLKSQRVDHSSLTADYSMCTEELCRRMKSLEVELETKRSEDFLFMADCQVRDEAHDRNLHDIRSSVETLMYKQMRTLEESFEAKISECNREAFIRDSWRSRALSDTQFSNQCWNVNGRPDKNLKRVRAVPVA